MSLIKEAGGPPKKLTWQRTVIGGQTAHHDFAAYDGNATVGRIYRDAGTSHSGAYWFWAMQAFGRGINRHGINCHGTVTSKQEAATMVEQTYARCLKRSD